MKYLDMYLKAHADIVIGRNYSDIIVDDIEKFLSFVYENGYYVSEILWWEYARIDRQNDTVFGGGGPRDPANPNCFWSETNIQMMFSSKEDTSTIIQYIQTIRKSIPNHKLTPSFTVKKCTESALNDNALEIIQKYLVDSGLSQCAIAAILKNIEKYDDIVSEFSERILHNSVPFPCVTVCVGEKTFNADSLMGDYKRIDSLHAAYSYLAFLRDDPDCAVSLLSRGLPIK